MDFYGLKYVDFHDQVSIYMKHNNSIYPISLDDELIENKIYWHLKTHNSFEILDTETVIDAIFLRAPVYQNSIEYKDSYSIIPLKQAGNYHPRIYRPFLEPNKSSTIRSGISIKELRMEINKYQIHHPNNIEISIKSLTQLATLKRMLTLIFSNIYPTTNNLATFGHTLKDLIILACIEIEAQLKGIYSEHKKNPKGRPYFNDYYELKKILNLDKYSVDLPLYPELPSFTPFKNWTIPKKNSIVPEWYDAYNGIKHNNDNEFVKATLKNAISAVSALAVLLKAQYGDNIPYWQEEIGNFFTVTNTIEWSFEEHLLPPFQDKQWEAISINF